MWFCKLTWKWNPLWQELGAGWPGDVTTLSCLGLFGCVSWSFQFVQIYHFHLFGTNVTLLHCRWRCEHPWGVHLLSGSYLLLQAVQWGPRLSGKGPWPWGKKTTLFWRTPLFSSLFFCISTRRWWGRGGVGDVGKWSNWKFVFILFHVPQTWASFPEEVGICDLFSPVLALCLSGQAQFEMPYVVRLHNFHQLSAPQPCFTFSHPNRGGFLCVCPLTGCVRAVWVCLV